MKQRRRERPKSMSRSNLWLASYWRMCYVSQSHSYDMGKSDCATLVLT